MHKEKKKFGIWQGQIIWHRDDLGAFHWGSPQARADRINLSMRNRPMSETEFRNARRSIPRPKQGRAR